MPLSQIDPICALLVIDLQKGIASLPTAHPSADVIAQAARLARAFRNARLPLVLVNVTGSAPGRTEAKRPNLPRAADWAEIVPELEPQAGDYRVTKERFGAFLGTDLDARLKSIGATQVVLAGIATSIGVESTARSAYDLGYHVVFVSDAMTDLNADAHRHSIERIFPRMGETCSTDQILALLAQRAP